MSRPAAEGGNSRPAAEGGNSRPAAERGNSRPAAERGNSRPVSLGLQLNDEAVEVVVEARESLLDLVRRLGLTGTHSGCEQGACGACTLLLDGEVVRSCLILAVQVAGASVTTIESFGTPERLHPVQEAMQAYHGLQCGFCTPGMVLTAIDLLERVTAPDEEEVREALAGNLCRCTGYRGLIDAVVAVGRQRSEAAPPP